MKRQYRLSRIIITFIFLLVIVLIPSNKAQSQNNNMLQLKKADYVSGQVIVKFREERIDVAQGVPSNFYSTNNVSFIGKTNPANIVVIKIDDGKSVQQKINELKSDPNVEYAEPNYYAKPLTIYDQLWGLNNTGQLITNEGASGTVDADIDAVEAWTVGEGQGVVVAVIDSGVAYKHHDLLPNMWNGTNCKSHNGSNLGGCVHGYSFREDGNDNNPLPRDFNYAHSHGTHVAGTIAGFGKGNNRVTGVAPKAVIMGIDTDLSYSGIINSIYFAKHNGAKIINASFGGPSYSQAMYDAIQDFGNAGGLFVAAAGNDNNNNDGSVKSYPASYNLPNVISVAATDFNDEITSFSNYGATSVHVGAPGKSIFSAVGERDLLMNNFTDVAENTIPTGWTQGGDNTFGVRTLDNGNKVLYGDKTSPYESYKDSYAQFQYNLSSLSSDTQAVTLTMVSFCQTENTNPTGSSSDYMELLISPDGNTFTSVIKWNGHYIGNQPMDLAELGFFEIGNKTKLVITPSFRTANFTVRFRWVTNNNDIVGAGCLLDNVGLRIFESGVDNQYAYYPGTSMAAPHVSGLAALIWGHKPNLTVAEVKQIIMETGDSKSSLSGKTSSGKRINAGNAMDLLGAIPTANPPGATYAASDIPLNVTLSTTLSGATIYYTLDGTSPTTSSTTYTAPINITGTTIIKAIASNGSTTSSIMTEIYKFPVKIITTIQLDKKTNHTQNVEIKVINSTDQVSKAEGQIPENGQLTIESNATGAGDHRVYIKPRFYLSALPSEANSSNVVNLVIGDNNLTFPDKFKGGDFNNDDIVNAPDFAIFAAQYGNNAGSGDLNGDGMINGIDFAIFALNYGQLGKYLHIEGSSWTQ
jgi:subtilisin family serine protease